MPRPRPLLAVAVASLLGALALPERSEWGLSAGQTRRAADLIAALGSDAAAERARAEREIVRLGRSVLPFLQSADVANDDLETRLRLRRAAARIEWQDAPPAERDRHEIRRTLARGEIPRPEVLDTLGTAALPLLVDRWTGPSRTNGELLAAAVDHAARHGGPHAGPFLVSLLGEARISYATLLAAGAALERLAGPKEIARLRGIAANDSGVRRALALRVLFARGDASDLNRIADHFDDPDRRVRIACTLLLWSPEHRPAAQRLLGDSDESVRLAAAAVLAETGRAADAEALERLLGDRSHRVRMTAVDGLARRGRLDALAPLRSDPSTGVRIAIEQAEARRRSEAR